MRLAPMAAREITTIGGGDLYEDRSEMWVGSGWIWEGLRGRLRDKFLLPMSQAKERKKT